MKIGVVGDVHFSQYSSIVRSRGLQFSTRLENCVDSINWAERTLIDCDYIVYLGDFFDSSSLNAEELTALSTIRWNGKPHRFLCGNHEMGLHDLSFNSATALKTGKIITQSMSDSNLGFIPYILNDEDRKIDFDADIIFSHNDIKGIQLGGFTTTQGFEISDIKEHCRLYINGHLHNHSIIDDTIINLGNLTGQNFSEDASKYRHYIMKVDTTTFEYELIENPFAFNFYKITDIRELNKLEGNAVIVVKCDESELDRVKSDIAANPRIRAHKLIVNKQLAVNSQTYQEVSLTIDHLKEFENYVYQNIGTSDIVKEELVEVAK